MKPLAEVGGRALIQHVIENTLRAKSLDEVLVATDSKEVAEAARGAGVEAVLTDPELPSGTDRMAAALANRSFDLALNIQGDEPEIPPAVIDSLVERLKASSECDLATAAAPIRAREAFLDPNRVKVVVDGADRALYFSRSPIPYLRTDSGELAMSPRNGEWGLGHVGIYAFRRAALFQFVAQEPSELESSERLEQLRALQAGMRIAVVRIEKAPAGIDTPADLAAFSDRVRPRND